MFQVWSWSPVNNVMWRAVLQVVAAAGYRRDTADALASACNARIPRFWSRFLAPGTESIDDLGAPDWVQSVCPVCSLSHREVLHAFQPALPVWAIVGTARADRTLCALAVPGAILASHWSKQLDPSALPLAAPFKGGLRMV